MSLVLASSVNANGLAGQRLEKNVGQYVVDIGTDQEFTPQPGGPVRFDFNLLKSGDRTPVNFTDVDVYITKDGVPLMDSDVVIAKSGPTLVTYTFPESGAYSLETTFFNQDSRLADATFPLTIGGSGSSSSNGGGNSGRYLAFGVALGIIFGIIIGLFVSKRLHGRS